MEKILLEDGFLLLRSVEGRALANDLLDAGSFWEYISNLIDEKALAQARVNEPNPELEEMFKALISKMGVTAVTGGAGAIALSSPTVNTEPSATNNSGSTVSVVSPKPTGGQKRPGGVLGGMMKKRGQN